MSEVEEKVVALGYIDWHRENKSIGMFYHFDAVKVLATGRYDLVPANALATLQAKLIEKDADIARLQAERDGDVAKAVAAEAQRLRPHYQSQTATDAGRRQMLDHFETFARAALALSKKDETNG